MNTNHTPEIQLHMIKTDNTIQLAMKFKDFSEKLDVTEKTSEWFNVYAKEYIFQEGFDFTLAEDGSIDVITETVATFICSMEKQQDLRESILKEKKWWWDTLYWHRSGNLEV